MLHGLVASVTIDGFKPMFNVRPILYQSISANDFEIASRKKMDKHIVIRCIHIKLIYRCFAYYINRACLWRKKVALKSMDNAGELNLEGLTLLNVPFYETQ